MPDAKTVRARWVAGFHAELPDKTPLIPGETVVNVSAVEAAESDHWHVEQPEPKPKKADS